jgi:hypothetical protein
MQRTMELKKTIKNAITTTSEYYVDGVLKKTKSTFDLGIYKWDGDKEDIVGFFKHSRLEFGGWYLSTLLQAYERGTTSVPVNGNGWVWTNFRASIERI